MINEILDFSKLEAGELSVELVPTDVENIVSGTVDMLAEDAAAKGIALYTQVRAGMPDNLLIDPSRFRQIVLNLLGNAIKFTSEGSVTTSLELSEVPKRQLVLSVRDTGVGIDPERLDKIFLPFKQSKEGQQVYEGGTGLGLSIVRRWVTLLGGEVSVESNLGEGSTFTVQLPIEADGKAPVSDRSAPAGPAVASGDDALEHYAGMGSNRSLRILVADDNKMNREVVEMQLDYLGFSADYVANGEEAVRAVLEHAYDVVLMDISMPVMDGEAACRAIRELTDRPQPRIVAVTASAMPGDREKYLAAGMDHYLSKPLEPLDLAVYLSTQVEHKAASGEAYAVAPERESEALQYIDMHELENRLGKMLQPMLQKIGPTFISELPARIERLEQAQTDGALDQLAAVCHALKGSASSVGAAQLTQLCEDAEIASRSGELISVESVEAIVSAAHSSGSELARIVAQAETD